MNRLTRRQRWAAAGVLVLVALGAVLLVSLRVGAKTAYPDATPGWAARWDRAAAESGRVAGEGWDVWLDVAPELEVAVGDGTAMDLPRAGAALDRLQNVPRFTRPYAEGTPGEGRYEYLLEQAPILRNAARFAATEGFNAAVAAGDHAAAHAWLRRSADVGRVARGLGGQGGLYLKQAIDRVTISLRSDALLDATLPPDPVADADLLTRLEPGETDWAIAAERELGLRQIQDFTGSAPFWRRLIIAADEAGELEDFMNHWRDAMGSGDAESLARHQSWEARLASDRWIGLTRPHLVYVSPRTAYYAGTADFDRDLNARLGALRVMLALESYFAIHARYPDSLDELVPGFLAALPVDRFAADGRLRYRVAAHAGVAVRGGYRLYSVGPDGLDEGGRAMQPGSGGLVGDLIFNTPPGSGAGAKP